MNEVAPPAFLPVFLRKFDFGAAQNDIFRNSRALALGREALRGCTSKPSMVCRHEM